MPEIKKQDTTIEIGCIICGEVRELTREETEYNRYFGTIGTIYICDKCKQAIAWAKTQMEP